MRHYLRSLRTDWNLVWHRERCEWLKCYIDVLFEAAFGMPSVVFRPAAVIDCVS